MYYDVIVIGGGPAGILAAGAAGARGRKVLLIEKNEKLGKKLFITGKGRCNVTNAAEMDEFMSHIPKNSKFLYSAFRALSNNDLVGILNDMGLKTKVERGGRVFPESDKSSDVLKALQKYLDKNNVNVMLHSEVKEVRVKDNKIQGVILTDGKAIDCESAIICTGGISYPQTGSTGDGLEFAKAIGHTITDLFPSLIPLIVKEEYIKELQGLSLKNVTIKIVVDNKSIYDDFGEMLFTHYGLSGPIILSASFYISDHLKKKKNIKLAIDLKPALSEEDLDKRVLKDFNLNLNKQFKNALDALLPQKLIPVIIKLSKIDENKEVNQISKEERKQLVHLLKNFEFTIIGTRPIAEAIVTSGGVSLKEISPKTMESKVIQGLYFAGEVMDLDAFTGGYNLQIAFSTGYAAGSNA
ncbi:MAG: NAD(P)/FAD-dependent oxidoreductase [Clostridia bacterium]|jgi:predicted Rossmann fold flavoprotein|nr:NAD(P)/FAD-dependent oxidoreductase [Clostridia bacterium]